LCEDISTLKRRKGARGVFKGPKFGLTDSHGKKNMNCVKRTRGKNSMQKLGGKKCVSREVNALGTHNFV